MNPRPAATALAALALCAAACASNSRRSRQTDEVRRAEEALAAQDVRDPARWDRLGSDAADFDKDVSLRAYDRAETLLWPDARPRNVVRLSLPFAGRWKVTQGNRGAYSHARLADRFAWDFQLVDGRDESNPPGNEAPTAFYGFGAPVLAPADGVVELVENDVPDNLDGVRNHDRPGGNLVVLRHGAGEFSRVCHLQRGSVCVVLGQSVARGEMIGRCGCSGNAVEPHLHFVLRVGPSADDFSVPMAFDDVRTSRGGDGVPSKGDVVTAAPGE
jgi:murein DD-endopeptidase MepM/ murein hydrolase activator NlpD